MKTLLITLALLVVGADRLFGGPITRKRTLDRRNTAALLVVIAALIVLGLAVLFSLGGKAEYELLMYAILALGCIGAAFWLGIDLLDSKFNETKESGSVSVRRAPNSRSSLPAAKRKQALDRDLK